MKYRYGRDTLTFLVAFSAFLFSPQTTAQTDCPSGQDPLAEVVSVQGTFTLNTKPLSVGDNICPGKIVLTTQVKSRAAIRIIATGVKIRLDQNTELRMDASISSNSASSIPVSNSNEKSFVELVCGAIKAFTRKPHKLDVRTPYVTAGVEGTEFLVEACDTTKDIAVHVFEGHVRMLYQYNNKRADLDVFANEAGYAKENQPPKKIEKIKIKSRDQVDWALYYPPISGTPELKKVNKLLAAGRIDEAKKILNYSPNSDQTLILNTIIKIAEGKSRDVIKKSSSIERLKATPTTRLVLSYVYQANLQLKQALETLEDTEIKDPLIWARIAELRLAHGDIKGSADAAQQAPVNFDIDNCILESIINPPNYIAKTLTVRGFTELARMNTDNAITEFQCAIRLASEDPLPRFGLGLAKIRKNRFQDGRHDIEIAALLDPTNSLIRSYLGKAFFEENIKTSITSTNKGCSEDISKHNDLAEHQFCIAKMLDPNDPTPWFYHAIKKQIENKPVEALDDLQKAIDKNDNRAVYRSEFLLDHDLTSRSAGLARIYKDLGFEQLALTKGWKSVNLDPGNHSAHRFLADTYATLPRHEIARVSELLQSQMRQPLNVTPIQPQLAEADLFILEGAGPTDLSFNEFNPVFTRNGFALQSNTIIGGNNTYGFDVAGSLISDRIATSMGYYKYDTDGFRVNNDINQEIANAFIQLQLFEETSVQVELRTRREEKGDTSLFFDRNLFSSIQRINEDADTYRVGIHHRFNMQHDILLNISRTVSDSKVFVPGEIQIDLGKKGDAAELQYLWDTRKFKHILGIGYVEFDNIERIEILRRVIPIFIPPSPVPTFVAPPPIMTDTTVDHINGYFYSTYIPNKKLILNFGVSTDQVRGAIVDRSSVNPKFGMTWSLTPSTTLRAAAFRTLNRTLIGSQTLEPTQLAGFNQFFNEPALSQSNRYGIGLDHEFNTHLYSGFEFTKREQTRPTNVVLNSNPVTVEEDTDEDLYRAYIFWVPNYKWALSMEFNKEKLTRDLVVLPALGDFTEIDTHRLELGAEYFDPSGFSVGIQTDFIKQEGIFAADGQTLKPGQDKFVVIDLESSYRLPQRYGKISILVKNLLDTDFNLQDTDPQNPGLSPERLFLLQANLFFH